MKRKENEMLENETGWKPIKEVEWSTPHPNQEETRMNTNENVDQDCSKDR